MTDSLSSKIRWDRSQQAVIEADPDARQIVIAPPGAGKTEVACGRVARLIESGLSGDSILLLSFTNAAVNEIRNRIRELVTEAPYQVGGLQVRTIDSLAALLRHRFSEEEVQFTGYTQNLESFDELLQAGNRHLDDYLGDRLQHFIVDEAQDVTGIRREVIIHLLDALDERAGVTVLGDPGQAIYGWTIPDADRAVPGSDHGATTLVDQLLAVADQTDSFSVRKLTGEYRTGVEDLGTFFSQLRITLESGEGQTGYRVVRERIADYAGQGEVEFEEIPDLIRGSSEDTMVLFRTTVSLAQASSYLSGQGVAHRLRFSGMPLGIDPWVGAMFGSVQRRYVREGEFVDLWADLPETVSGNMEIDVAWRVCRRLARTRSDRIDLRELRHRLAGNRPPEELARQEIGRRGPILSTIHAVKGREAPSVVILFPDERDDDRTDWDEEARVLYVGATRPRRELTVYDRPDPGYWGSLSTGTERSYRPLGRKGRGWRCQFFMGLEKDVNPYFSVSSRLPGSSTARSVQSFMSSWDELQQEVMAVGTSFGKGDWRYLVKLGSDADDDEAPVIGAFTRSINNDLWSAAERAPEGRDWRPGGKIRYIWLMDVRTFVAEVDSPYLARTEEPFRSSGFWLVPVIKGFPVVHCWPQ